MYVYMAPPLKVVLESQTFCILKYRRLGLPIFYLSMMYETLAGFTSILFKNLDDLIEEYSRGRRYKTSSVKLLGH